MVTYLKEHIKEEIAGAKDYLTKAIELKAKHPEWAAKFFKMAEMEIEHANCMTKMFVAVDKPAAMTETEYISAQKSIIDDYTSSMTSIEGLKKLYHTS